MGVCALSTTIIVYIVAQAALAVVSKSTQEKKKAGEAAYDGSLLQLILWLCFAIVQLVCCFLLASMLFYDVGYLIIGMFLKEADGVVIGSKVPQTIAPIINRELRSVSAATNHNDSI